MYNKSQNTKFDSQQQQQQQQPQQQQPQNLMEMSTQRTSSEGRNRDDQEPAAGNEVTMEAPPSGDEDQDPDEGFKRRRHTRHTLHQISEMEAFFKECPHPDEKQRKALGRELGLVPLQIKFWFQNKRTQVKSQQERYENNLLRVENDKLRAENSRYRNALSNTSCPNCGAPTTLGEMSFDEQQLRMENARQKEEIDSMSGLAAKYAAGKSASNSYYNMPSNQNQMPSRSLDLGVVNNNSSINNNNSSINNSNNKNNNNNNYVVQAQPVAMVGEMYGGNDPLRELPLLSSFDKDLISEIGLVAVEEINQLTLSADPLWVPGNYGSEVINEDEYLRHFPRGIGPTLLGARTESSRQTAIVMMHHMKLVEMLMDVNQWSNMFCGIVSRAVTHEVLSIGDHARYDGAYQVMSAEFQVPSPLVPTRDNYFIRFSKKHAGQSWAVVDISMDHLRPGAVTRTRRRPSGCIIQELPNGYSKVIWVEHVEVDDIEVHNLYKNLVNSTLAFGAKRWVAAIERTCEHLARAMATNIPQGALCVITSHEGRKSMMKLAERMVLSFSTGVGASTANAWTPLPLDLENVRVMTRKSVDDPGRPSGVVLSAATSLWLPVPARRVFDFLRSENTRNQVWDILSSGAQVNELAHIAKGRDHGNSVSLLRVNTQNVAQNNMLILQESCIDATGSFVVYAPIDLASMNLVLGGGNPDYVALLPSGFAVLPDGPALNVVPGPVCEVVGSGRGCLLTVAFQILVDSTPTAKLSVGSVTTVNNLIKRTVERIKDSVTLDGA
ncbi:homeobox-leucine zipper protein MERISTEM L1-like isoform X1 [Glycine soja]|uniref:homeobox-leucine zipper protein MERISTEM L1-like isoform X1 n=1 Tax=Glycine soja TaxID=3848 RepID=UPI00103D1E18|nr:homeobox-leucine zipper protein MERISTEM L1-like isoform X1 [Glycine soja]XP_028183812.1 homeobox-leucine zipper protein MERISTEM L1-like isoform X1 [Glycine soja]